MLQDFRTHVVILVVLVATWYYFLPTFAPPSLSDCCVCVFFFCPEQIAALLEEISMDEELREELGIVAEVDIDGSTPAAAAGPEAADG